MAVVLTGIDEVMAQVGNHLGFSEWAEITQKQVDLFAEATGDHQWIHVDVERAKAESPFGGPIAHGYLTLSMVPVLLKEVVRVEGFAMAVNYGTEKIRFPAPVPVDGRIRVGAVIAACDPIARGVQLTYDCTVELEGQDKPVCVARVVYRYAD
ncbi:MAG: putative enoyl-CoA hydratase 1 [Acidimicrobiales bacterium]|nr:putative enoyl-CoA hydratase 1 [Acidimicrobiales bacterium]